MDNGHRIVSRSPAIVWVYPRVIAYRIDAHPFQPYLVEIDELLAQRPDCVTLGQKLRRRRGMSGGATPRGANYLSEGIRFIRTEDVTPNWIDLSQVAHISIEDHKKLERSALEEDDVLLTITGALFGQSATVYSGCLPANISQHSVRMHFADDVDPRYVSTYLNSKYGQAQIQKHKVGATRSAIDYTGVKGLKLPLPPRPVQEYIGTKVRLAERCRTQAKELQKHIEELLESMLHLDDFVLVDEQIAWAQPQDVVTRWLNSGFYLPRYLKLQQHLESAGLQIVSLSELATCVRTKQRPRHGSIRYIQIGDIDITSGMITTWSWYEAEDAPNNAQRLISDWDVLVSTRRPTRRAVTVVPEELAGSYASVFLARLRAKPGNSPYYIQQYLRSIVGVLFLEQRCTETTYPVISEGDLETVPIPIVESEVQKEIEASTRSYEKLLSMSANLVREAEADVKALIEGRLDVEGIVAGRVQLPTWEDPEV
jgi:type I restriction enzyme S subunit